MNAVAAIALICQIYQGNVSKQQMCQSKVAHCSIMKTTSDKTSDQALLECIAKGEQK